MVTHQNDYSLLVAPCCDDKLSRDWLEHIALMCPCDWTLAVSATLHVDSFQTQNSTSLRFSEKFFFCLFCFCRRLDSYFEEYI